MKLELQSDIDSSYYNKLVDDAVDTISKSQYFEQFVSEDVVNDMSWLQVPESVKEEEVPFDDFMNPPRVA